MMPWDTIVCIVKSPVVPLQTVCCAEFTKYMSAWYLRAWSSLVPLIVNFNEFPVEHSSSLQYLETPHPFENDSKFACKLVWLIAVWHFYHSAKL